MEENRLHQYVEKDGTYLIKIKVNTNDEQKRSDLVDFFMRPLMTNKDLLPGCTVEAFYKHNLDEEELLTTVRTKIVEGAINDIKKALTDIKLVEIDTNPTHWHE